MHDGPAREVECTAPEQPAGRREHPVRDRCVDEEQPEPEEPDPRAEPHPVRDRTGDQAGVMIANIIWYAMNSSGGIVSASPGGASRATSARPAKSRLPIHLPVPANASEKAR